MALTRVDVRIARLLVPAGARLDRADLEQRVAAELRALLAAQPARSTTAHRARTRVSVPSATAPATVARAIARRLHEALQAGEATR